MRADSMGFVGPWQPVDLSGNLINGYEAEPLVDGATLTASLSADYSTLTLDFFNPQGGFSLFSDFSNPSILPTGIVSYDWSVDFLQSGTWLMETGVVTTFPGGDQFGYVPAGTYSGTATLNYTSGNYFSFGNIGFGPDAQEAVLTLTNFEFIAPAPEPGTALIFGSGLLALGVFLRRGSHRNCGADAHVRG